MSLPKISPAEARRLIDEGAVLIDIRGTDEHARQRISGARNLPVGALTSIDSNLKPVIFHCKSGNRTAANAAKLAAATSCDAYIVEGGIDRWMQVGLPVITDRNQPIEIMRQCRSRPEALCFSG